MKKIIAFILLLSSLLIMSSCMFIEVSKLPTVNPEDIEYVKAFDKKRESPMHYKIVDQDTVLGYLQNATPYKNSYDDFVYGEDYRAIVIKTKDSSHHYFVYRDKWGRTLIEMPYISIYKVDSGLFDYLDGILNPKPKAQ